MSQRTTDLLAPRVWVTRPEGSQEQLVSGLRAAGFEVLYEAMLYIEPLADTQYFREQLNRLDRQDGVIFISANAVDSFIKLASHAQLQALQAQTVYAVGKATAAKLAAVGIAAIHPSSQMSSEGLLALPAMQQVSGKHLFVMRGVGGRGYLQQQLQLRGAVVEHVELYQRQPPAALSAATQQLVQSGAIDALLVGSVETFQNIVSLVPAIDRDTLLVTPSARVSDWVRAAGFRRVVQAASASDANMIETVQQQLA